MLALKMKFVYKIIYCPCYDEIISSLAEYDELNKDFNCSYATYVLKCQ